MAPSPWLIPTLSFYILRSSHISRRVVASDVLKSSKKTMRLAVKFITKKSLTARGIVLQLMCSVVEAISSDTRVLAELMALERVRCVVYGLVCKSREVDT